MNILVIDAGTSSMRGVLFTREGKELVQRQQLYRVSYMENGWAEQDPSDWKAALYGIVKEISAEAGQKGWTVDAVAVTSQRSSVIPMDRAMRPLGHAVMWQDKRTNELCRQMKAQNDRVFDLCGSRINPVFSATKMTWIRENRPELYEKTCKFMVLPDYLIYLMTGEVCTDYTYGSRSLLMNIRTCEWDPELLELFHVEKEKLCSLVEPGCICGGVTEKFAEDTGCPAGIPVITAGGDQQCGAIGQGVVKQGILSVTAGTGGFLITAAEQVPDDLGQDVICNCSSIRGQYILESSVLTCCSAYDWFRKEFCRGESYEELNRAVAQTPVGSNGCICLPYFQGRSTPDWNNAAKGIFAGVTLGTTRNDMLRSLLEGICCEIGNGIDSMRSYVDISEIYVNGGLTKSVPFNEIQCSVYGCRIVHREVADATALGAFMVAAASLGIFDSVQEAYGAVGEQCGAQVYLPREEEVQKYREYRARMNRLYQVIRDSDASWAEESGTETR